MRWSCTTSSRVLIVMAWAHETASGPEQIRLGFESMSAVHSFVVLGLQLFWASELLRSSGKAFRLAFLVSRGLVVLLCVWGVGGRLALAGVDLASLS